MEEMNVDKLLAALDDRFFEKMAEQMKSVEPDIEPDPSISTIKELLGQVTAEVEYLKLKTIQVRKKIQDFKLLVKAKRNALEVQKSRIRQEALEVYQVELKQYIINAKELFNDVSDGKKKLPNSVLQEMLKVMKPEKPTQNNLDDLAILKTEELQKAIIMCEKKTNEYEELHGILSTMAEKYESKNLAVRAHKGLLEAELRNLNHGGGS